MTLVRAGLVVPMGGAPLLFDGALLIDDRGRIEAIGPWGEIRHHPLAQKAEAAGESIDLAQSILLPGLINTHCHLDYTMLRGAIPPPASLPHPSFAAWVGQINAHKATFTPDAVATAIRDGFAELKAHGTTAVCNLTAYPELIASLLPAPIRTWWLPELIDLRSPDTPLEEHLLSQLAPLLGEPGGALRGDPHSRLGLCPHAPYTASPALYRRLPALAEQHGLLLSTHLAESADEEAMFAHRSGPLFALLQRLGRPMGDCGPLSSFGNAVHHGLVGPGWLLAHVNELEEDDFQRLAEQAPSEWRIAHCPRSHAYFGHSPFPWERLRALGVCISIGTDSLASNDSLNLFAEMQAAAKATPAIPSVNLLESVTTEAAKALGQEGMLGVLRPGAWADMIALPAADAVAPGASASQVYSTIINHHGPVSWMMLEGTLC